VEVHSAGQVIWGRTSDLSQGGCFVEMAIPVEGEAKFEIVLWIGASKLRLQGAVASASPGFGIGVRFTSVSPQDQEFLERHIQSLA
jgi:hypothetical protein